MLASGRLRVHLKKALGCGGNTYVKLEVAKQKAKTRTCNEQAWDQTFDFTGLLRALTVRPLELEAKDAKMMKSNVSLGNASVDLSEVAAVGALDFTATLSSSQGTIEGRATRLENESFQGADGGFDEVLAHGALHMRRWKAAKWQLRWFELTQHDLLYYSSQEDAMPRGVLPLECIIAVERAADPKTFTLVVVGDAAKAKAMHGTADGKGRSSTGEPSVGRQGSAAASRGSSCRRSSLLGGAADDARLQSERWVNALRLLTHSGERARVDDGGRRRRRQVVWRCCRRPRARRVGGRVGGAGGAPRAVVDASGAPRRRRFRVRRHLPSVCRRDRARGGEGGARRLRRRREVRGGARRRERRVPRRAHQALLPTAPRRPVGVGARRSRRR